MEFEFYYRVEAFLVCTCGSTSGGSKLCFIFYFMLPISRFLKLNNELKVLLISDVATEKAAAALAVRVGELGLSDQTQQTLYGFNLFCLVGDETAVCSTLLLCLGKWHHLI